jgi:hypothetical protein
MSFTINNSVPVFKYKQILVEYTDGSGYPYPRTSGILAPSTDVAKPLYSSGRLLAQYGDDAPNAALIGAWVNYDPASSVVSQQTCAGIIPAGYNDLTGIDITNVTTETQTINNINIVKLLSGVTLYEATIIAQNSTAVVTGFNTDLSPKVVTETYYDGVQSNIIAIQ